MRRGECLSFKKVDQLHSESNQSPPFLFYILSTKSLFNKQIKVHELTTSWSTGIARREEEVTRCWRERRGQRRVDGRGG